LQGIRDTQDCEIWKGVPPIDARFYVKLGDLQGVLRAVELTSRIALAYNLWAEMHKTKSADLVRSDLQINPEVLGMLGVSSARDNG
jgi:hypothetical protein